LTRGSSLRILDIIYSNEICFLTGKCKQVLPVIGPLFFCLYALFKLVALLYASIAEDDMAGICGVHEISNNSTALVLTKL